MLFREFATNYLQPRTQFRLSFWSVKEGNFDRSFAGTDDYNISEYVEITADRKVIAINTIRGIVVIYLSSEIQEKTFTQAELKIWEYYKAEVKSRIDPDSYQHYYGDLIDKIDKVLANEKC